MNIKLIYPSAFDDSGLFMIDTIREVFDILDIQFESVSFKFEKFDGQNAQSIEKAIYDDEKCPVVAVRDSFFDPNGSDYSSHAMVATGIEDGIDEDEGKVFVQLKNSHRDDPDQPGMILDNSMVTFPLE